MYSKTSRPSTGACPRKSGRKGFRESRQLETPVACRKLRLLQIPECGVGLYQFESGIPGLVAAPHHLSIRLAACFGVNQQHAPVQRQVRSHDGHTPGWLTSTVTALAVSFAPS